MRRSRFGINLYHMPKPKQTKINISHSSITKAELLDKIKAQLDKEVPTDVALTNNEITITCDVKSAPVPKPKAK